jgi:putative phosphoesterase
MIDSSDVTIGVISDTHGLVRPEMRQELQGCDLILHAGDVGTPDVLDELHSVAPLHVVCGNVDHGVWADVLPMTLKVEIKGLRFYLLHNINHLDIDPVAEGFHAVVFGHTHLQHDEEKDGVLYFNPASAGPRRHTLPVSMGRITIEGTKLHREFIQLAP